MKALQTLLMRVAQSTAWVMPVILAAVVGALVVPLPAWLVDAGIALSLAASFALLGAAALAREPLGMTSFPALLLVTTLGRLSLNVSSTRLALTDGHAGDIIQAFGEFVVRGEYVVGAVVFAILALVQFLVVAKGAERVAEVSARFTLDAMPGKQMAIDADLRAGAIDQAQARRRRRELERESQLFGAMDGAMKFVKGDVIAGLVIVAVNLLGGTAVGMLRDGMPAAEAATTYALLAIGDGLVSQIPSLCVAVAAGLLVTKVAPEEGGGQARAVGAELFDWRVLAMVSGLGICLAALPGMPTLTLLTLGGAAGAGAYFRYRSADRNQGDSGETSAEGAEARHQGGAAGRNQAATVQSGVVPLALEVSGSLATWVHQEGLAQGLLEEVRGRIYRELGVQVPPVHIRLGAAGLPPGGYSVLLDEVEMARGSVDPASVYVLESPAELELVAPEAVGVVDPSTGKSISRLPLDARARVAGMGWTVRTAAELLSEHLFALLERHAANFLGVQEVQSLLSGLDAHAPVLVREALQKVPLPLLTEVLRRLLREAVSIRNLRAILEALVSPVAEGDAAALAERCRQALHRYLTQKHARGGPLFAYLVDPSVEEVVRRGRAEGAVDPLQLNALLEGVDGLVRRGPTVLLASPDVRRPLRALLESRFPKVPVLSCAELDEDAQIRPLGRLSTRAA